MAISSNPCLEPLKEGRRKNANSSALPVVSVRLGHTSPSNWSASGLERSTVTDRSVGAASARSDSSSALISMNSLGLGDRMSSPLWRWGGLQVLQSPPGTKRLVISPCLKPGSLLKATSVTTLPLVSW